MKRSTALLFTIFSTILHLTPTLAQTPPGFSPATNNSLKITYSATNIVAGRYVPLELTSISPEIALPNPPTDNSTTTNTTTSHTVLLLDLDAPSGPTNTSLSPLLHWLAFLSPGITSLPSNQSAAIVPYAPPQPPPGSPRHRFVGLLLASSNSGQNFTWPESEQWKGFDPMALEDRFRFDVQGFIRDGGYEVVAGTWFETENITASQTGWGTKALGKGGKELAYLVATVVSAVVILGTM